MRDDKDTVSIPAGQRVRRRIAVGLDGGEPDRAALRWAVREATRTGSSLLVVTAWPGPARARAREAGGLVAGRQGLQRMQQSRLAEALAGLDSPPPVARLLVLADPVTALCHAARFADLVVIGVRNRFGPRPDSIAASVTRCLGRGRRTGRAALVVVPPEGVGPTHPASAEKVPGRRGRDFRAGPATHTATLRSPSRPRLSNHHR